jgi:hypothetical protein
MDITNAPAYHERFKDAPWYGAKLDVTVGGAGGIGSWLTFFLSRTGHNIFLYDHDTVEAVNVGGQMYGLKHVGETKVDAMKEVVSLLCGEMSINDMGKFGDDNKMVSNVTIMGFDNMVARRQMAEAWFEMQKNKKNRQAGEVNILIDGRMETETGMIFAIRTPNDFKRYMETEMFDDAEVADRPCSFKATSHNGAFLAANIVAILNNHITNKKYGKVVRDVRFKLEYELPTLTYATSDDQQKSSE